MNFILEIISEYLNTPDNIRMVESAKDFELLFMSFELFVVVITR